MNNFVSRFLLTCAICCLLPFGTPTSASVSWPAGQLLPTFSPAAPTQDLISLVTGDTYQAVNMDHATGHEDVDGSDVGWLCQTGVDTPEAYMVYGPYDTTLPAGANTVTYSIKIDNNTADNNNQVEIDVHDATTNTILASQVITREEFTAAGTYVTFSLSYAQPNIGDSMEFRVYWYGAAYIKVNNISLERSPSTEQAVLFSSLKGLVNATQPRIYAYDNNTLSQDGEYTWLNSLGLGYSAVSNNFTEITKYRSSIKGLVVYDDNQLDTINLATTIASLDGGVVCPPLYLSTLEASPYNLPILADLRNQYSSSLAVYQALYNNYWPQMTHKTLIGLNPNAQFGASREYAAAVGAGVVWLDARNSSELSLLDQFFASMGPGTVYLGWWPDEGSGVTAASDYGIATCASDWSTNLSVFSGTSRSVQANIAPAVPALQNKIYLSFVMSDGDNLQYIEHFMRVLWGDSNRGKVPMGWTISPALLDIAPGVLNYYETSASADDCLLSGPSGYGYIYPDDITNATWLDNFVSTSNSYCMRAGLRGVTVWGNGIQSVVNSNVGQAFETYAPSLLGITDQNAGAPVTWYGDLPSMPFYANYCPTIATVQSNVANAVAGWSGSSPLFVLVQVQPWQGITPTGLLGYVQSLSSSYDVVRPDTFFQLMREQQGLPLQPVPNGIHTLTPGSALGSRLDDANAVTTNGNPIDIQLANGSNQENWNFTNTTGTSYNVAVGLGPYCLQSTGSTSGSALELWGCNGAAAQTWVAAPVGNGFNFALSGYSLCMAVSGSGSANGTPVQVATCNGSSSQLWYADYSGLCLATPGTPTGLSASGTTTSSTSLSWSAVSAPTNCSVGSYTVYKNGSSIGTSTSTGFSVTGLSAGTTYTFTVAATDSDGTGGQSSAIDVTTTAASCTASPSAPTGLTASGTTTTGTNLSWSAVSPPANCSISSYTIYKNGSSIGTSTSTGFAVTGLSASTTYTFTVAATDSHGTSSQSSVLTVTTSAASGSGGIKIACGNSAQGSFVADTDFSGGAASSGTSSSITTSKVFNPAPTSVYQHGRKETCTYTIPGLTAGASYTVRLDFCEYAATAAGQRTFDVSINGTQVLTNFDIYATAGGEYIANAQTFSATANSSGEVVIIFTTVVNNALVAGIEVTPTDAVAAGGYALSPGCAPGAVLDDENNATTNGNPIVIEQENGSTGEEWTLGAAANSTWNMATLGAYCLQASGTTSGSAIELWACSGATTQDFVAGAATGGGYNFALYGYSLCMNVSGGGSANGTAVQVSTCSGTSAQQWTLEAD